VVGSTAATEGAVTAGNTVFGVTVNGSGVVTLNQYSEIDHPIADDPSATAAPFDDQTIHLADGAVTLTGTATITDNDGDTASSSQTVNIGANLMFHDDGPVISSVTTPLQVDNSGTVSATGDFVFSVGADANGDHNDITNVTFSATVAGNAVTSPTISEVSEDGNTAVYNFSFNYDTGTGGTDHETGTLTFNKLDGTYTVDLDHAIQSFTLTGTAGAPASAFVNYNGDGSVSSGPSNIATVALSDSLFIQFTGVHDKTGSDHLTTTSGGDTTFTPVTGAFGGLELFSQSSATVTVSSSAAGVAGNTIQGGEVLDFNLYNTDPQAAIGTPTASATSMFIELDGVGTSEDMIVVLKLYDTVTHQYTTEALMVQNSDIIKDNAALAGTAYSAIVLDSNDGLIVIEPNDYQNGNTNLVIVGAQIAGSDDGISGTALNFNGALGTSGGSSGTQPFTTDVSDAPFKIQNIGFLTQTNTDQAAELNFGVTVTDADGDTATQNLTVDVGTASANTAAVQTMMTSATPLSASNDTSSLLASNDNGGHDQRAFNVGQNAALMGALAAVGLSSMHNGLEGHALGHASDHALAGTSFHETTVAAVTTETLSVAEPTHVTDAGPLVQAAHEPAHGGSVHDMVQAEHALAGGDTHAPQQMTELLQGSDGPAHGGHANASAVMAAAVTMPSAAQLAALTGHGTAEQHTSVAGDHVQHNEVVAKVLADALHGGDGHGPSIDALVHALPAHGNGGNAALEALASHGAAAVSMGHMAFAGAFGFGHGMASMEQHPDAPPAHG